MQVCLIVPGPLATVSGGHTYDRRMADGLRALGHDVRVVEIAGRLPDPDQAAIYAARTAWAALPTESVKLIDGLALPAFDGLPLHQVTALVHHPASLETGISEDLLSHVLAGRKDFAIETLANALERIGYRLQIVPVNGKKG